MALAVFVMGVAAMAVGGCRPSKSGTQENEYTRGPSTRLQQAIKDARSGKTFMESPLRHAELTSEEIEAAREHIQKHQDMSSYHLLMALRECAVDVYTGIPEVIKSKVLCDALGKMLFLNDFGHLGPSDPYDGESAKALVSIGRPSLCCLRDLLVDQHEAMLFGSEEATGASIYKYRRSDFAYRYIMVILGRTPTFPSTPEERDKLIERLQSELGNTVRVRPSKSCR